jgi:enterochelin esterase-like enzyme
MPRFCIAPLLASCLVATVLLSAQTKHHAKPESPSNPPGIATLTSFDTNHSVVGWLEIVPFQSKLFHNTRMLRVLVPANYFSPHNRRRSYPVLYLQDGQQLFDLATSPGGEWRVDEAIEHLVGSFKIPPMFVVGIDNAGDHRASEYLPYPDPLNSKVTELRGKEYARFLLTEVMPFIERRYRIARGAMNTGLGGAGYGADIALYAALARPGVFGHVLMQSPELWIGKDQLLKDAQDARELPRKICIGVGTRESAQDPTRSPQIVNQGRDLEAILVKKGMGPERLRVQIEEGGQHDVAAWSRRLPDALTFLYGQ